jgi:hypothetical protein
LLTTEDKEHSYISFLFGSGFSFHLIGYKPRSSHYFFPKSWKLEGITQIKEIKNELIEGMAQIEPTQYELIDQQNDYSFFCSQFDEKVIKVNQSDDFLGFKITQTGPNSDGTNNFSLSALEYFEEFKTNIA